MFNQFYFLLRDLNVKFILFININKLISDFYTEYPSNIHHVNWVYYFLFSLNTFGSFTDPQHTYFPVQCELKSSLCHELNTIKTWELHFYCELALCDIKCAWINLTVHCIFIFYKINGTNYLFKTRAVVSQIHNSHN